MGVKKHSNIYIVTVILLSMAISLFSPWQQASVAQGKAKFYTVSKAFLFGYTGKAEYNDNAKNYQIKSVKISADSGNIILKGYLFKDTGKGPGYEKRLSRQAYKFRTKSETHYSYSAEGEDIYITAKQFMKKYKEYAMVYISLDENGYVNYMGMANEIQL